MNKLKAHPRLGALIIGAVVLFVVGQVLIFSALLPAYSLVGESTGTDATHLDAAETIVRIGLVATYMSFIAAILAIISLVVRYIKLKSKTH